MSGSDVRRGLVAAARALEEAGLVAGTAGNLSARLADGRLLVTPAGRAKGSLEPGDLLSVPLEHDGEPDSASEEKGADSGAPHPSTELPLHRACYAARADVGAVVHAHPPALLAASLRELAVEERLPEVGLGTGPIATVPFLPSGSRALADAVGEAVSEGAGVVVLERHGAVSVARGVEEALHRMELAELAAYTVLLAEDGATAVDRERLDPLLERLRELP